MFSEAWDIYVVRTTVLCDLYKSSLWLFKMILKAKRILVRVMGKWAQYEKVTIKRVFSLVNVIILTLIRSNLLVFKQKTRTGHKIIACK